MGTGRRNDAAPGVFNPSLEPRGARRSLSSALAPPLPPPHSLPARPTLRPALALLVGNGRRARGAGRGASLCRTAPWPPPPRTAQTAPLRLRLPAECAEQPEPGRSPRAPPRRADGVDFRPASRSMDSDSGEQSEGEPVTATGTAGSRQPSPEGWGQEEAKSGQEIASVPSRCQAGG